MITMVVRGLPGSASEESVTELFSNYGVVRSIKLAKDLFSGQCRGFATIQMEGHEARAAMSALDGHEVDGRQIRVGPDRDQGKRRARRRR